MADDTDVYILLLYYYHAESLTIPMKLQSPQSGRAVIDIAATVQKLKDVISELLPAHALRLMLSVGVIQLQCVME